MKGTHHSEYLKLASVYIKSAENSFRSEKQLSEQWQELQFLSKPNFEQSLKEYNSFHLYFTNKNIETCFFPVDEKTWIDSIYCRDASIATDFGMIICNMGKKGRIQEPKAQLETYLQNTVEILGEITFPGTLEGGDAVSYTHLTLPTRCLV